jgi:magnesium transporter
MRKKTSHKVKRKAGLPPGSLVHIGNRKIENVRVSLIEYDVENYSEKVCKTLEECFPAKDSTQISWINIDGLHDTETIGDIGKHFDLHPLLLEDVLNTRQRPKIEEYENHIFFTLKMLSVANEDEMVNSEQVSFVLGKNWVISFQEQEGDIFEGVRIRLRESKGNIRKKGADYLLYRLIDSVVDNYFNVTEYFTEVTETLEDKVLEGYDKEIMQDIQHLKKQIINLRKAVNPLREAIISMQKDELELIEESTTRYLRDVYEDIIQVYESIDTQRDILNSIMDLYLSGISNRMNQVMQVLTIIATIFIPLTFIVGVYGMNFDHIPELHWKYGYFAVWGIMIAIFIAMLFYFKKKDWL